jgi:hypothetical protein
MNKGGRGVKPRAKPRIWVSRASGKDLLQTRARALTTERLRLRKLAAAMLTREFGGTRPTSELSPGACATRLTSGSVHEPSPNLASNLWNRRGRGSRFYVMPRLSSSLALSWPRRRMQALRVMRRRISDVPFTAGSGPSVACHFSLCVRAHGRRGSIVQRRYEQILLAPGLRAPTISSEF